MDHSLFPLELEMTIRLNPLSNMRAATRHHPVFTMLLATFRLSSRIVLSIVMVCKVFLANFATASVSRLMYTTRNLYMSRQAGESERRQEFNHRELNSAVSLFFSSRLLFLTCKLPSFLLLSRDIFCRSSLSKAIS